MKKDIMYSLTKEDRPSLEIMDLILKTSIETSNNNCHIIINSNKFDYMNDSEMKKLDRILGNYIKKDIDLFYDLIFETIDKTNWGLSI